MSSFWKPFFEKTEKLWLMKKWRKFWELFCFCVAEECRGKGWSEGINWVKR